MTQVERDHFEARAVIFEIDGRASRFTVQAFATGLFSSMGHNPLISVRDLNGQFMFDPEQLNASRFKVSIRSSSLTVQNDVSEKDRREMERLMNREVLETSKFPEITYEATDSSIESLGGALSSASLNGALTLHGVTRNALISARVTLLGSMLRASGDFTLRQSDFDIKPVSVAGGALKLKDELKLSFEMVARSQE
jgi:polyisoprenoid-binding protein YceI